MGALREDRSAPLRSVLHTLSKQRLIFVKK